VQFVDKNIHNIIDSATHPLDGTRWWLNASSPWQCLGACIELAEALKLPDPTQYVSHLPVHQDGTCNGLQHYAALGGDIEGARSVNLLPNDSPQDVYTEVCKLVKERIKTDATNGIDVAKLLIDKIDRRVVKQTIMTSVYGVTFIGARKQISGQLKDKPGIPDELNYQASVYITKKTFESLKEMFSGAKTIMEWLAACSRIIAKSGFLVQWLTPLGLHVVQPYIKAPRKQIINTVLQSIVLQIDGSKCNVDTNKQRSAFPPNFIHSLDSTHMMLTAIECHKQGLTYASVHDSYWTHAANVDKMNVTIREKFVEMHQRPILQQLREYWLSRHPGVKIPPVPKLGSFNLDLVKKNKNFFH